MAAKKKSQPTRGVKKAAAKPSAKPARGSAPRAGARAKTGTEPAEPSVADLRRAALEAVRRKLAEGRKLTGADFQFLREAEEEEARGRVVVGTEPNMGATVEEDVEEWLVRDGVVRGQGRSLGQVAALHGLSREEVERVSWGVARVLLERYGFEGVKGKGRLTGVERQALQWVKSIEQLGRASQEWEMQMEQVRLRRAEGKGVDLETFGTMVQTARQLSDRRDGLVMKVRELSVKQARAGTGRGQKAMRFEIHMKEEL